MYDHVAAFAQGFEPRGIVRSFDNKYYAKAAVVEAPSVGGPQDVEEFEFVRAHTDRVVKVPLTGAYTMEDWSYDEHYGHEGGLGASAEQRYDARRPFRPRRRRRRHPPECRGPRRWPAPSGSRSTSRPRRRSRTRSRSSSRASTRRRAESRRRRACTSASPTTARSGRHVIELDDCLELQLEFANRDSRELGTKDEDRPGYADTLALFKEHGYPGVGLGVLDIHSDFIETAELVRDRVLYAAEVLGDPGRIQVNPDCGLRTRSWEVVYEKLANMVQGTRLAEDALN